MKQSTKRVVSMMGSLVLVVLGFIIYFDFTQPVYNEAQTIKATVAGQQAFVDRQQESIKQVKTLISSFQSQAQLEQVISLALPNDPDIAGGIAQLNGIENNNRISPASFNITIAGAKSAAIVKKNSSSSSAIQVSPMGTINFSIKMTGTYEDFKNFLKNLETNIRIFDLQSLSIQPSGKSNQDTYNFNAVVVAYYQVVATPTATK